MAIEARSPLLLINSSYSTGTEEKTDVIGLPDALVNYAVTRVHNKSARGTVAEQTTTFVTEPVFRAQNGVHAVWLAVGVLCKRFRAANR